MRRSAIFFAALLTVGVAFVATGQGLMGPGSGYGGGMMNWWGSTPPGNAQALTIDQVADLVQKYLKDFWNPDLELTEVMEFDNQFYAEVKEKSAGNGAFEVLVNKWTGAVVPEPGPNMMWNTKYGMMQSMMGSRWQTSGSSQMQVSEQDAKSIAESYLSQNFPGAQVEGITRSYGYYTIDFEKDGKIIGMLSVNGYSGQVWYHSWHGAFIQEIEFD